MDEDTVMAKRLSNPLQTPPTWQERIAAALMDAEYGTDRNAWRPEPHIDMVRADPSYFLVAKHLSAAAALIESGVLGDEPVDQRAAGSERWDSTDRIIICPPPKSRCECGSTRAPFVAVGLRAADAGPGRFQRRHALRDLYAVRCPDCGQVDVWDMDSDEWWTLDESDYGPDGSTPPPEWAGGLFDLLNESDDPS